MSNEQEIPLQYNYIFEGKRQEQGNAPQDRGTLTHSGFEQHAMGLNKGSKI